jgi:1,2-beta-oligoglucan phosphorylase
MDDQMTSQESSTQFPYRLESPTGLSIQVNANGSIRRMDHRGILLTLFLGTEIEGGPANLYLRRLRTPVEATPLLGPRSPSAIHVDQRGMTAAGEWHAIQFRVSLKLAASAPAWFWHVWLKNTGSEVEMVDLVYAQDLGLADYGEVRINEYYVSHYVDHTPIHHQERGHVLASRQNRSMAGRNPWSIIGALGKGVAFATDALQFHGMATRAGELPVGLVKGLPGTRLQHEHSMVALQEAPVRLEPGEAVKRGFFGWFEEDHPAPTSAGDLLCVDKAMRLPEAAAPSDSNATRGAKPAPALFSSAPLLNVEDVTEGEIAELFGGELREVEREDGKMLSFFTGTNRHVVLKAKELKVLRPHAHILRTGDRLFPDEASLTSTSWMGGVFHSMVTQGHVSINRFLSTTHSYLSLLRGQGQRLFVELSDCWYLLDVPSAFEMAPESCRWIYKHRDGVIAVRSEAATNHHALSLSVEVLSGMPVRFLLCNHVAINGDDGSDALPVRYRQDDKGVFVYPAPDSDVGRRFPQGGFRIQPLAGTVIERMGGDEVLFQDRRSRNQPYLCMIIRPARSVNFSIKGCLLSEEMGEMAGPDRARFWTDMTSDLRLYPPAGSTLAEGAARLAEILPWFIQNVLIHYLAPRGLEQYTGGGWGTRDIAQGPVEMLLALSRYEPIKDLLIRVFKTQNPDGDWPQWFMFFDRERNIRARDSHGDIVFWPVLALAQYLAASEDASLLDEVVPFFHPEGDDGAEKASVWRHVERALAVMNNRVIPGTRLAAYGNGDWNDSMQPNDPTMRERLCSAWTVTLHYQTLEALATALHRFGRSDRAKEFEAMAADVRKEFQRYLLVDDILTGFAYFHDDGRIDYLLHPRDGSTGLSYSLLPMIHAIINELLTPQQAKKQLELIQEHLHGPDGAHLFDRPMEYRGGLQKYFQRAESASFFGREIGLMYTHAHLRYAEALARYGDADGFFRALCQANPIGIRTLVSNATLRQANCYYSSSDPAFSDRYQAFAEYGRVKRGEVPLDGGWRIYSSGPGIWTRLVLHSFLGLCREQSMLAIDPVIPQSLDGLRVEMAWGGALMEVTYRIEGAGCGPSAINLNGADLPYSRGTNPYRTGAAQIPMAAVLERLTVGTNRLTVRIG